MRRSIWAVLAVALLATVPIPIGAATQVAPSSTPRSDVIDAYARLASAKSELDQSDLAELGPNPYLSLTFDRDPTEVVLWRALAASIVAADAGLATPKRAVRYAEREPQGIEGRNDTRRSGEAIDGFGTGRREERRARVTGSLVAAPVSPRPTPSGSSVESDGSIGLANAVSLERGELVRLTGEVGDGPDAATGDFDFFALGTVSAGERIVVATDTSQVDGGVDTYVALYDTDGELIEVNDDTRGSLDSRIEIPAPRTTGYVVMVTGCCQVPSDPFDPGSGAGERSIGRYEIDLGVGIAPLPDGDSDVFLVDLAPGDVIGAAVLGAPEEVELYDPSGTLVMGSDQNVSFAYPRSSPLRHDGNIGLDHVAAVAGTHAVRVLRGSGGRYVVDLVVARPGGSDLRNTARQEYFLDFDGAVVDTRPLGGADSRARLSPLRSFLHRWDLDPGDERAVIDAVITSFRESIDRDLSSRGGNGDRAITGAGGDFDVVIRNSRDHPDPGADPDVTRIVIGGSIAESGIDTIGIAESIDVGNFDRSEIAVVLLDFLSGRRTGLNVIPTTARASIVQLVGRTVGTVAAHEAGHLLGNWHTQTFNDQVAIMDAGGDLPSTVGVGADGRFGTADDEDVDFVDDEFFVSEGFLGREDPLERSAFGLSTGNVDIGPVCTIGGTPGDDVLRGSPGNDVICGLGGNDLLSGLGGRDRLVGGPGDDVLRGGVGDDVLVGDAGGDRLIGSAGADDLDGGDDRDRAVGGPGRDRCAAERRAGCEARADR